MNSCEKHACSLCCYEQDVPLLNEDIDRLRLYGYCEHSFARETGGLKILLQKEGCCVFYGANNRCEVYGDRPLRCRLLPYTYDFDSGRAVLEEGCRHLWDYRRSKTVALMMEDFIRRLQVERRMRLAAGGHGGFVGSY